MFCNVTGAIYSCSEIQSLFTQYPNSKRKLEESGLIMGKIKQ